MSSSILSHFWEALHLLSAVSADSVAQGYTMLNFLWNIKAFTVTFV